MSEEDEGALLPRDMLQMYPDTVVEALVEDDAFRSGLGLDDGLLLVLGRGGRFGRRAFYRAIRSLHAGDEGVCVDDVDGESWALEAMDVGGRPAIRLSRGETVEHIHPHLALHADDEVRLAELDRSLADAGLWSEALPEWHVILRTRPLDDDEVRRLQRALEATPTALAARIDASFAKGEGGGALIAPVEPGYYALLAGDGVATSIDDLARSVVRPHVLRLASLADGSGPRMALLLASHSSLLAGSALVDLTEDGLSALLDWAVASGDLLSRVGAVELGLAALARVPAVAPALTLLVASVLDQDPGDRDGRLALLSGVVAFVGSELSRTRALDHLPPFQRRMALFAQASFFERVVFGRIDARVVADWGRQNGLRRFYFQTMVDRRLEPRWTAEHIAPEQLKAEFASRISLAAGLHEASVPAGPLRDLLFGDGEGGLRSHVKFPQSFLPGPLEGRVATGEQQRLPADFERVLDEALAADVLEPRSVIALINLRGVFAIDAGRVDRAVALIRAAGHRFDVSVDAETRGLLFNGLAALASETRNPRLAEEVRMMVRKDRLDGAASVPSHEEFAMALNAAAAHAGWDEWSAYLAEWIGELAFNAVGEDAEQLRGDVELLCAIDPGLRRVLGAAKAALASVTSPI